MAVVDPNKGGFSKNVPLDRRTAEMEANYGRGDN